MKITQREQNGYNYSHLIQFLEDHNYFYMYICIVVIIVVIIISIIIIITYLRGNFWQCHSEQGQAAKKKTMGINNLAQGGS